MSIFIVSYVFIDVAESESINKGLMELYPELLIKDFIISPAVKLVGMKYEIACEDIGIDPSVKGNFMISLNNKDKTVSEIVPIFKKAYGDNIKLLLNNEVEL